MKTCYVHQLKVVVADPTNLKPSEMLSILMMKTLALANGLISIFCKNGVFVAVQNARTICLLNLIEITASKSTFNTIIVDNSVKNNYKIVLKDVDIPSSDSRIKISDGADIEFLLKDTNRAIRTNCQEKTDYPTIEVPSEVTAIFSEDGTLNTTAQGYGGAIRTKGYYRDGKSFR